MCGRYATTRSAGDLSALFESSDDTDGRLGPDHNVAPTDPVPVVRVTPERARGALRRPLGPGAALGAGPPPARPA